LSRGRLSSRYGVRSVVDRCSNPAAEASCWSSAAKAFDRAVRRVTRARSPHIVANDQKSVGTNDLAAVGEEAGWVWAVHERLDRVDEVGDLTRTGEIAKVPLDTSDTVRQSALSNLSLGQPRLDRAQRNPGAPDVEAFRQPAQTCTDAAPEVDDMGADQRIPFSNCTQVLLNLILDVAECILLGVGPWTPDGPMDSAEAGALAKGQKL